MAFFKFAKAGAEKLSDEEIVERVLKNGEQQLLEMLYDRYSGKIFHKCVSLIKDREAAKDCTHDIMVKIFMNLVNFKGKSAFSLWVHSITYNYCMDYLQKQKRISFDDYGENEYDYASPDEENLESKLLQELKLTQLETVFELLSADERVLLLMRYQDDMSVKQIAESLGVGESAVKMRLKRSRDHLAELVGQLNNE